MKKLWVLPVLLVLAFVAVALLAQVQGQASQNPLAQFYHDGKLTIPGGRFTKELQQLLFPPPAPKNYTTYALAESAYPTLAWVGTIHDIPKAGPAAPDPSQSVASFFGPLARWWDRLWNPMPDWGAVGAQIRAGAGWLLFGWWTGDAAAACGAGGGTCFRILAGNSYVAANAWSATSGGASCACNPTTTDSVVFDSATPAGTTDSGGATIVAANWTMSGANVNFTTAWGGFLTFGLTVNSLTVTNGNLNINNGTLTVNGSTANFGSTGGTFSAGGSSTVVFAANATVTPAVGRTFDSVTINSGVAITAQTNQFSVLATFTLTGTLSLSSVGLLIGTAFTLSTNITATGTAATNRFEGATTISAAAYIVGGASTWQFDTTYTNNSTSASWSAGTGGALFKPLASGTVTVTFAGSNLSVAEWNNVTFDTFAGSGNVTYNMATRGLKASGMLTTTNTAGSGIVLLDTTASNLPITSGGLTLGALGGITLRASTFTTSGNVDTSADPSNWNFNTSTIVFSASASLKTPTSSGTATLYNLTINLGATVNTLSAVGADGVVTVNGSLSLAAILWLRNSVASTQSLVLGASGSVTAGSAQTIGYFSQAGSLEQISAGTYTNITFELTPTVIVAGDGYEYRALGNLSADSILFAPRASDPMFFNSQTFNMTLSGSITDAFVGATNFGIKATSGTWTVSQNLGVSNASDTGFYIQFGSTAWSVGNTWFNVSTNTAKWQVGTSTVTFNHNAGGTLGMTFAGSHLPSGEFFNVSFASTASSGVVYALSAGIVAAGTLTILPTSSTTSLDTVNGSSFPITAASMTVGLSGTLTAWSSLIKITGGTFDSSAGTFNSVSSTVEFTATGNLKTATSGGTRTVYNLTVDLGATLTLQSGIGVGNVITANGTVAIGAFNIFIRNENGSTDPIVVGVSGSFTGTLGSAFISFFDQAGTLDHIPAASYTGVNFTFDPNVAVAGDGFEYRVTGNISTAQWSFAFRNSDPFFVNSQTFNVSITATTCMQDAPIGSGTAFGIKATSGTWTLTCVSGGVQVTNAASSAFYIQLGSTAWTIQGPWLVGATTNSAKWSVGTSTVTFQTNPGSGGLVVVGLDAGNFAVAQFYNLTVDATCIATCTGEVQLLNHALIVSNQILITRTSGLAGESRLDTNSVSSFAVTAGSIVEGASGSGQGSFEAYASTITLTGTGTCWSWNAVASGNQFIADSSLVVFSASCTVISNTNTSYNSLWNVTIKAGATLTLGTDAIFHEVTRIGDTGPATLALGSHILYSKAHTQTDSLGYLAFVPFAGSTITADGINGALAWNPVNANAFDMVVLPFNYGNARLLFTSSGQILTGTPNGVVLEGNVTTSAACWLHTFENGFAGGSKSYLKLNGYSLTCGSFLLANSGSAGTHTYINATVAGSAVTTAGSFFVGTVQESWLLMGSATFTVGGVWTNNSTSANWSAGTSTVVFNSPNSITMTFGTPVNYVGGVEFNNVTFDPNANFTPTFTMSGAIAAGGTLKLRNSFGGTSTVTLDVTVSNYQITAGTVDISLANGSGIILARDGRIVTKNWNAPFSGYSPTCFSAPSGCLSAAVVEFTGTGTITPRSSAGHIDFWKVQVDLGAVTTNTGVTIIGDSAVVNGTLRATWDNTPFEVNGYSNTANPFTLGGSADISLGGYIVYDIFSTAGFNVVGGSYETLQVSPHNAVRVDQTGNITIQMEYALLMGTSNPAIKATYYTNNWNVTLTDVYPSNFKSADNFPICTTFFGDQVQNNTMTFHLGSSTWTSCEFAPHSNAVVYLETSHVVINSDTAMSPTNPNNYTPYWFIIEEKAIVYGGSATIDIHAALRMWPVNGGLGPDSAVFYAQNATINTYADQGYCTSGKFFNIGTNCPGDVHVDETLYAIDFGASTWNIVGSWYNLSTQSAWNSGTATIRFTGHGTLTMDAATGITLPELATVTISGSAYTLSGTLSFTKLTISGPTTIGGSVPGSGGVSIALTPSSGYAALSSWTLWAPSGPNIGFPIRLTVSSATLTVTVTNVSQDVGVYVNGVYQSRATRSGASQTMTVLGPWSTQDISITGPPGPGGGGGGGGGGGSPPAMTITATAGADGLTYTLAAGAPAGYLIANVTWGFGDGSTGTGNPVTHTFALGATYTVTATVALTSGYKASVTATVTPLGPAQKATDYIPLVLVVGAILSLLGVLASETERRKLWLGALSLVLFWVAIAKVAATAFPTVIPRNLFVYLPLAAAAVAGIEAWEGKRKLLWVGMLVAAVVVWWLTVGGA